MYDKNTAWSEIFSATADFRLDLESQVMWDCPHIPAEEMT